MISTLEISRKLGITCAAVNKRVKKLGIEKFRQGAFAYISEKDFELILQFPVETSEQTSSKSSDCKSFSKSPPTDPLVSENLALRRELKLLKQELEQKESQKKEKLQMLQEDSENQRLKTNMQLQEKEKMLQEARRERSELRVLLFRQQDLTSHTQKELEQAQAQIKQLQQLPMVELQKWIKLLETSHDTFANNIKLLSDLPTPPLIVHEGGKKEQQSFYKQFAK